jgi:hypothetical protein
LSRKWSVRVVMEVESDECATVVDGG